MHFRKSMTAILFNPKVMMRWRYKGYAISISYRKSFEINWDKVHEIRN